MGGSHNKREDILASYDYHLPQERIAQLPARRREFARLMCLDREKNGIFHHNIVDLPHFLRASDLLVLNDTKVVPARLQAIKPTGGLVEIFLLDPTRPVEIMPDGREVHQVLVKGKLNKARLTLFEHPEIALEVLKKGERGQAWLAFPFSALRLAQLYGSTPLPPYIKRPGGAKPMDKLRYQTVYARREGAVAAPTAGLHLSKALLAILQEAGVEIGFVTLHVGYGTFAQPDANELAQGRLHGEWVQVSPELAVQHQKCRQAGGRVVAVGTTSVRALEWAAQTGQVQASQGDCHLLIEPGFAFKAVDGLLTNFHLPRTTLLMLVAAFGGQGLVMEAYDQAVCQQYRFYSYGDAMLII